MEITAFDRENLQAHAGGIKTASFEYHFGYLTELRAKTMMIEPGYVDRHYLDDFCRYYARSHIVPPARTTRLHFFRITQDQLGANLNEAYSCDAARRQELERTLSDAYLGFAVVRPLPQARLGRTVLRTYPAEDRRHIEVVRTYVVHLGALTLTVKGLAYQQQDGGVAVCASTALWSALQKVARVSGHRSPTPSQITEAAGSAWPAAHGLEFPQMATAIARLGYTADMFAPEDNRAAFRARLVACLDSQLPVILYIQQIRETATGKQYSGHAITVTGYSEPPGVCVVPSSLPGVDPIPIRGASVEVVYAHDDNLGSHAHYELFDSNDRDELDRPKQMLRRGRNNKPPVDWWGVDEWEVVAALVPKPIKLRMPLAVLFPQLRFLRQPFQQLFPKTQLSFGCRFTTGVEYKKSLLELPFDPAEVRALSEDLPLPRHLGVVSVTANGLHRCDVLHDVSQVEHIRGLPSILAVIAPGVPSNTVAGVNLAFLRNQWKTPVLLARSAALVP